MKIMPALKGLLIVGASIGALTLWAQDLSQQVTVEKLQQPSTSSQTFSVNGSSGADTSRFYAPWTYTSLVFNATGSAVDAWLIVECGNDTTLVHQDSLHVVGTQKILWGISIDASQRMRVLFKGGTGNGSDTQFTNSQIDRQW